MRPSNGKPLLVNAGAGAACTDSTGCEWLADTGYDGGRAVDHGSVRTMTLSRPELYRTSREGMRSYGFALRNGQYVVLVRMAENSATVTGAGQRVFSVRVNGNRFDDIDLWDQAGGHHIPVVISAPVEVSDGSLRIEFIPSVSEPVVSAIEIHPDPVVACEQLSGPTVVEDFSGFGGSEEELRKACRLGVNSNKITQSLRRGAPFTGVWSMRCDYQCNRLMPYGANPSFTWPVHVDCTGRRSLGFWFKPDGTNRRVALRLHNAKGQLLCCEFRSEGVAPVLHEFPLVTERFEGGAITAITLCVHHAFPADFGYGTVFLGPVVTSDKTVEPPRIVRQDTAFRDGVAVIENYDAYATNDELWFEHYWVSHATMGLISLETRIKDAGRNSLRMDYSFGKSAYSGWVTCDVFDFSRCNALRFWVKGDGSGNILSVFFVAQGCYTYKLRLDFDEARTVVVPFADLFCRFTRLAGFMELGFWVHRSGGSTGGTLYLDNIECYYDPALPSTLPALPPGAKRARLEGPGPHRINCGGDADVVDGAGRVWLSDRGYYGGSTTRYGQSVVYDDPVLGPVLHSERYGLNGYGFEVPNGRYRVRIVAAESWSAAQTPRVRSFGVSVNGSPMASVDIWESVRALYKPLTLEFETSVGDGLIEILFDERNNLPKVDGIEIEAIDAE